MFEEITIMAMNDIKKRGDQITYSERKGVFNIVEDIPGCGLYPAQTIIHNAKEYYIKPHKELRDVVDVVRTTPVNIVDFGGRIGCHYDMLNKYGYNNIIYHIIEVPETCAIGMEQRKNDPIYFYSSIENLPSDSCIDIFYAHNSLQYMTDIDKMLQCIVNINPLFILLQSVPIGNKCVLTTQQYAGITVSYWFLDSAILEKYFHPYYSLEHVEIKQWEDNKGEQHSCAYGIEGTNIAMIPMNVLFKRKIDRFPKNMQGEPLVYGDTVYWWEDERVQTGTWRGIGTDGPTVENGLGELQWPCLDWLCSSPEDAEATGKEYGISHG